MPLTITINEAAPGTLTIGVGTPGVGVPAGGTAGQVLTKVDGTDYNTVFATPSADYITAVTAPLSVTSGNLSVNLSTYLPLAGGTMNANATVDLSDTVTGTVSEVGGYGFAVSSASNINLKTNVLFDRVLVAGAVSATTIKPTGVEFPDLTLQTSAGISAATAAATYQTLAGMSSYLTTSTAASTYAPIASPTFTGTVTIPAGASISGYLPLATNSTISGSNVFSGATNSFSGTSLTFGNSTATSTINVGSGAIASGITKTINIGINGAPGSTHNITIGSAGGTSSTVLRGSVTVDTTTAGSSNTIVANTAYVANELGSKANINSPSLTGTPLSTTAAADTNTTQIATTAFVIGQASSTTPSATGTAAIGTSLKYARADHVHVNPLPSGGTTGQVLSKVDGTSYNVAWTTPSGGGYITSVSSPLSVTSNNLTVDLSTYLPLAGGTMAGYLYSNIGNGMDSVMTEGNFKVRNTSTPTTFGELTAIALRIANAAGQMQIGPDMITFPDATTQASAGYPLSGNPSGFVTDAPSDSNYYSRYNGAWAVPSFGVPEAPNDGLLYARNNLNWTAFTAGMSAPAYSNAVWYGGAWYSANVTSLTDGYGNYYNALTL